MRLHAHSAVRHGPAARAGPEPAGAGRRGGAVSQRHGVARAARLHCLQGAGGGGVGHGLVVAAMEQADRRCRFPVVHVAVAIDGGGIVGQEVVQEGGLEGDVRIIRNHQPQDQAAHLVSHLGALPAEPARAEQCREGRVFVAHPLQLGVQRDAHVVRTGTGNRGDQLRQMRAGRGLQGAVGSHRGVAAFGVAQQEQLAVVNEAAGLAPRARCGQQVHHGGGRRRSGRRARRGRRTPSFLLRLPCKRKRARRTYSTTKYSTLYCRPTI